LKEEHINLNLFRLNKNSQIIGGFVGK